MYHPPINDQAGAVMFAELGGFTCSICAPTMMSKDEVEAAAMIVCKPVYIRWWAVDKSKPPYSIGQPTPNRCNQYKDRLHWFLVSDPRQEQ